MLEAPSTDWDRLYLRLKLSPLGSDFTRERFLSTPVGTITWLIEEISLHEQRHHNLAQVATAHLNTQVMWALYGLGGNKGPKPKAKVQDFLPFPEAEKRQPSVRRLSPELIAQTRAALRRALVSGELPYSIFIALWQGPNS